jgi:hypothetical protein
MLRIFSCFACGALLVDGSYFTLIENSYFLVGIWQLFSGIGLLIALLKDKPHA